MYDWEFSHIWLQRDAYLAGAMRTLVLATLCCLSGTVGGILVALLLNAHPIIRWPVAALVFVVRGIPELVLLFFIYFFPYKAMFGVSPLTPFWCAVFAFSFSLAIFAGGLFDSAYRQVPASQLLGARSIGLGRLGIWRHVLMPNVARGSLPGLLAFWISILKITSLASVIGVQDIVYVARLGMAYNARAMEAWIVVALVYVTLVVPLSLLARRVEGMAWMTHQ